MYENDLVIKDLLLIYLISVEKKLCRYLTLDTLYIVPVNTGD